MLSFRGVRFAEESLFDLNQRGIPRSPRRPRNDGL